MAHSPILDSRPTSAPTPRLKATEADSHIQAIDVLRARQDHQDFLALVDDEILPAMRAFEVLLHLQCLGCEIDTQGLCGSEAFRRTSSLALHIWLGPQSSCGSHPHLSLECVHSRRHPGEFILVTSGPPRRGGTSGRMRRYDQVTYGFVFDLLEQLLEQIVAGACQAQHLRGVPTGCLSVAAYGQDL
jgi:hypothetical protein